MFRNQTHWKLVLVIVLVNAVAFCSSGPILNAQKAKSYLQRYGYISSDNMASLSHNSIETNTLKNALKEFQRFNGLPVTGKLDKKTLQLMSKPRCGVQDNPQYGSGSRSKRYIVRGGKWFFKDLDYRITKYSKHLERSIVDEQISNAFNLWSEYVDLNFIPKIDGGIDFEIRFEEGDHGDGKPFDGSGIPGEDNALAHAAFPFQPNRGDIHFDDAEDWTSSTQQGINLFWSAVHEIGHSLGLEHTNVTSAVMAPYYQGGNRLDIDIDDILGMQEIYGQKTRKFRAELDDDYGRYSLIGSMYTNRTENNDSNQTPKKISEGWPGVPDDFDAAFSYDTNKHYFFKGTKYWRYDGRKLGNGYPKQISEGFPGMPDNVVMVLCYGDRAVFFKNGYHVYDMSKTPLP